MAAEPRLAPIRKGLLEFLVLKIVGGKSVYVPDILRELAGTEFATLWGGGTLPGWRGRGISPVIGPISTRRCGRLQGWISRPLSHTTVWPVVYAYSAYVRTRRSSSA